MKTSVLLIEDNPKDRRLVEIALAEAIDFDHKMSCATSFAAGLDLLDHEKFEIVLLDLNLPDANGIETVQRLRAEHPQVPIVVLTGLEDRELGDEAIRHGAQDFLVKGKMFGELLWRAIRYSIERHRIMEELRIAAEK